MCISEVRLPGQSIVALVSWSVDCAKTCPNIGQTACFKQCHAFGRTTDNGVGKRSQAGLSLLEDIDSSTRGFCAILSRDLVAQERSLSFTYGRPVGSCSSLEQMYFGKRRAIRINLFWSAEFC